MIHKLNKFMSDALFSQDTEVLVDAMRYSVLSPGKRLRGLMLMEIVNDFEVNIQKALPAAASIEFLHAYSLVHDDLPSIDNDDMRRGMLSCHKKYGEATAILTGNALLTLAFQMLCYYKSRCATIVEILSKSVGYKGMLKGQIQDIKSNSLDDDAKEANIDSIVYIHKLKTGNLFGAACKIGALIGGANSIELAYYKSFGENFGIAFQIADDFEDAAGLASVHSQIAATLSAAIKG